MDEYDLCLYVVGHGPKTRRALGYLRRLCEAELAGRYHIDVIDIASDPEAGELANIIASPTLIRRAPLPVVRILGDLSDQESMRRGLGLSPNDCGVE